MKKPKPNIMKIAYVVFFIVFFLKFLPAQTQSEIIKTSEVIASAGDCFKGSHVTLSWTLGENTIETFFNNNLKLTQGFQQPVYLITSVDELAVNYQINIYPNPAREFIFIEIVNLIIGINQLKYDLHDINGKLIETKIISGTKQEVNLQNLSSNLYILRIYNDNGEFVKTYKIEKMK